MSRCCNGSSVGRCAACRSERRLVVGAIAMMATLTLADDVSSRARQPSAAGVRRADAASVPQSARVLTVLTPLDLALLGPASFAD